MSGHLQGTEAFLEKTQSRIFDGAFLQKQPMAFSC